MRQLPPRSVPGPMRDGPSAPARYASAGAEVVAEAPDLYERGMAALAHALILLSLPGLAMVALIWWLHRGRVPFVEHHARQAMRWQVRINVAALLTAVVLLVLLVGGFGAGLGKPSTGDTIAGSLAIVALLGLLLLFVAWMLLALTSAAVGAGMALLGREPRPPRPSRRSRKRA